MTLVPPVDHMESLVTFLRRAGRLLVRNRAMAVVSILAFTLGIGLTTTMFSIVYGALLRGLPFDEPEQIVHLETSNLARDINSQEATIHQFLDWREQQRSFEGMAAFYFGTVNISGSEKPERYSGTFLSANTFRLLRVRPLIGRDFRAGEDAPGAEPVAILSYGLWRDRYASDPNVLGRVIRVNGKAATVIGVMPDKFGFPRNDDLWLPLDLNALTMKRGSDGQTVEVMARLRDGVSLDQAVLEFSSIMKRLALEHPEAEQGLGVIIKPYIEEFLGQEERGLLYTMLGAVLFVLLIACANVANLLLSRAIVRSKEVGIRTALGASRFRLMMQFIGEALVLATLGAVLGLGLAYVGIDLFNNAIAATNTPFFIDIRLDGTSLMFAGALILLSTLIAGAMPAIQASRTGITDVLKDESRGSSSHSLGRLSRGLVILEIALSCGLLVGAGLMTRSVVNLRTVDLGIPIDEILSARVGLPEVSYPDSARQVLFYENLLPRLRALPGVQSAAIVSSLPGGGGIRSNFAQSVVAYAEDRDYPDTNVLIATPGFLETLGLKLEDGRDFGTMDRNGSLPVALVNRAFAQKYFPNSSAIGQRVRLGDSKSTAPWVTIVGITPETHVLPLGGGGRDEGPEAVYLPLAQNPQRFMSILLRGRAPVAFSTPLRDAVASVDPDMPTYFMKTLAQNIQDAGWFYRVFGTLFMVFGLAALFLASVGLYAVMSFSVSRRTREVGIRMAIGAQANDVLRMVLRQGLLQVTIGMFFGLAFAAGLSQLISVILFRVNPRDPMVFLGIVLLLGTTAMIACYVPARRATRVDPLEALRTE